jgi:hypothetical protein
MHLLNRDRSPGDSALRRSKSADVALSEKSPYLGGCTYPSGLSARVACQGWGSAKG